MVLTRQMHKENKQEFSIRPWQPFVHVERELSRTETKNEHQTAKRITGKCT